MGVGVVTVCGMGEFTAFTAPASESSAQLERLLTTEFTPLPQNGNERVWRARSVLLSLTLSMAMPMPLNPWSERWD